MNKQRGFAHPGVLLIILILAAVGGAGFYVWHKKQVDNSNPTVVSTSDQSSATTKDTSAAKVAPKNYLPISQWGVEFQLPTSLKTMDYELHGDQAYLGSSQLQKLAPSCTTALPSLGYVIRTTAAPDNGAKDYKKVGTYYYRYTENQSGCTDSNHPKAADLQLMAMNQLRGLSGGPAFSKTIRASSASFLEIKEWGIKIATNYSTALSYKITDSSQSQAEANISDDSLPGDCKELGLNLLRFNTANNALGGGTHIGKYYYGVYGGPGACNDDPGGPQGSINRLRAKINASYGSILPL